MRGIDGIIAARHPRRGRTRRGANLQAAAADGFNYKGTDAAVKVRFIALGQQIGQAYGDLTVFIAAGNGPREDGQSRGVIDRRYHHRGLNRRRGFRTAIVLCHGSKGIQGAVGIGRRCPVGLIRGVDGIIAARHPRRGRTRRGSNLQAAAADGFDHKGTDAAVKVRFIALGQQIGQAHGDLTVFIAAGNGPREGGQSRGVIDRRYRHSRLNRRRGFHTAIVLRHGSKGIQGAVGIGRRCPVGLIRGVDGIIAARHPRRGRTRRGSNLQAAAADGFNYKGTDAAVKVRFIALGQQIGQAHGDLTVFIAAGNGPREDGQSRGVIDRRYHHRGLNRRRGFHTAIVLCHGSKGIQGAVGIGRRCPVGLIRGVDGIIAARHPRRGRTRRGSNLQAAAADGFDHKGTDAAVKVRFIALGQQIGQAHGDLTVFIAAGNGPREGGQSRRVIDRRYRHRGLNRRRGFHTAIVLCHGSKGIQGAVGIGRRCPVGLIRGIDGIIAARHPRRGRTRRGSNLQAAAADGFDHKGTDAAVKVRFIALGQQIGQAHGDLTVFIAAGNGPREGGQSRGVIDRRYRHRGLNRRRGFHTAIVLCHGSKGIQGAVGIGRRCPVGLIRGVDGIIAARHPRRGRTRRGSNLQAAAADGFDHKGTDAAVKVRFIALGQQIGQAHGDLTVFIAAGNGPREGGQSRGVIDRRYRHRGLNRRRGFYTAIVLCHGSKGIQGAVGIGRRCPVGLIRGVDGIIAARHPRRGRTRRGADLQVPLLTALITKALTLPSTSASLPWASRLARFTVIWLSSLPLATAPEKAVKVGTSLTGVTATVACIAVADAYRHCLEPPSVKAFKLPLALAAGVQ